jgi:hypothetical protein
LRWTLICSASSGPGSIVFTSSPIEIPISPLSPRGPGVTRHVLHRLAAPDGHGDRLVRVPGDGVESCCDNVIGSPFTARTTSPGFRPALSAGSPGDGEDARVHVGEHADIPRPRTCPAGRA